MSHLRLLICRVDEDTDQMTELDRLDLPPMTPDPGADLLDALEARVLRVGSQVLGRLCELQWEEIDAQAVARYRARRRQRHFSGNGLGEKANDRLVAWRQKRRGMQWGERSSDALAALRTLLLNGGWERYWQGRSLLHLSAA